MVDRPTWYFSRASSYNPSRWRSSQNGATGEISIQSGAAGWGEGFETCFLRVPQAVGPKGNFQHTCYKTFYTTCRPRLYVVQVALRVSFRKILNMKGLTRADIVMSEQYDMSMYNTTTDSIDCRSQLATIVLAAREEIIGVIIGGVLGHALCTGILACLKNFKIPRGGDAEQLKCGNSFCEFKWRNLYLVYLRSCRPRRPNDCHSYLGANGDPRRGRRLPLLRSHGLLHGPGRLVNYQVKGRNILGNEILETVIPWIRNPGDQGGQGVGVCQRCLADPSADLAEYYKVRQQPMDRAWRLKIENSTTWNVLAWLGGPKPVYSGPQRGKNRDNKTLSTSRCRTL